jgi:signal transduction histidine kinase
MVADTFGRAREARLELRRWWARERLTGVALVLFAARWAAWAVAAIIVILDVVPKANVQREPFLLFGTLAENIAATLYLPFLRPRARETFRRWLDREVDDILVVGLLEVAFALSIVYLSGGWDSPYYLFAVASLLIPASSLELRANLALASGFVASYALIVATAGNGTDGPWHGAELNNFVVFLSIPFIVSLVVQFFGWMGRQLAEQREAAREALAENVRLQQEREELAAAQERSRIAREIHDGVAQSIYMLSLNLEAAADAAAGEPAVGDRLQRLVGLAKQTLLEVRHYIFDLKPLLDGDAGIAAALRNQAREFTAVSGLPVAVQVIGTETPLSPARSAALFRIAQEALANVYRHAAASSASLLLEFREDAVVLEVRDDGAGIPVGVAHGRGLRNMEQRARDLWGTLVVKQGQDCGTIVRAVLPGEEL